jgi:hypothetical protein
MLEELRRFSLYLWHRLTNLIMWWRNLIDRAAKSVLLTGLTQVTDRGSVFAESFYMPFEVRRQIIIKLTLFFDRVIAGRKE